MKKSEEVEHYARDPIRLIDILDKVIKRYNQKKPPEMKADRVIQYNEISKTIDRLKETGTIVPDELRRLKIELSHEAETYEKENEMFQNAVQVLKEIEFRLGNSLTQVRAILSNATNDKKHIPKVRRYVKRTSPAILAKELRKALRELGGSGKKAEVLQKMEQNLNGKFKSQDLEKDVQGNMNWEKWAVAEKTKMIKSGTIKSGSRFGVWELRRK
jgi:RNAse (barnase) inhibitor barstar